MKIEHQVCTKEQAIILRELGVIQEGHFSWYQHYQMTEGELILDKSGITAEKRFKQIASAYTVAELGVMLGYFIHNPFLEAVKWITQETAFNFTESGCQAHCYASWLIHLLETNLITPEQANKRLSES